jgi:transposase
MYVGLDVHKKQSYYSLIDESGIEVESGKFPTLRENLKRFASELPASCELAIEASTSGIFVYECLEENGMEVHLAHPALVKPFAKKHVKTDRIDSKVLAQLLRMNYLPESYVPGKEARALRILVRHRASLVSLRTSIKNKIHSLLTIEGIKLPELSDLFGRHGMEFLAEVELRKPRRVALDNYLELLEALNNLIDETEKTLKKKAKVTEEAKLLMSIPGIGFYNALLILSEIGEIGRFSKPESLACYAGLVPKVEQSGNWVRYGHLNRHSNGFLRWALIQSARIAVRTRRPNKFKRAYLKLKSRRGEKVAIVGVARHLVKSVYWVLKRREYYKEVSSFS